MVTAMTTSIHPACGKEIRYHGNATGHCDQCHETFYGEGAFDRHQVHNRADGKPTCIPPAEYKPGPSGNTFWADHEGQWHYGQPMTADEYQTNREREAEASRARMAILHRRGHESRPNGGEPSPSATGASNDVPGPGIEAA